jgi:superfamily II DNA or RNA helicase
MQSMRQGVIQVSNTYSKLTCNDPDVIETLAFALRKRAWGYENSRAYRQRKWDGFRAFFSLKTGKFLTGLLPEVKAALTHLQVHFGIQDTRKSFKWRHQTVDANFLQRLIDTNQVTAELIKELKGEKFILHDYQIDFTNQMLKFNRGVIQAPTGAGKTAIMMSILKSIPDGVPTLVLCNKKQLVEQNYMELTKWGFKNVGRLYDTIHQPNVLTCATWQSLHHIERLLPHIKVIVVDEIHEMMSKETKLIYPKLTGAVVRAAVSATPFKHGGKDEEHKFFVKGHFGPIFKTTSEWADEHGILQTEKLQEAGILSKSRCTFYKIKEPDLQYAVYADAVKLGIAENFHLHEVIQRLIKTLSGRTLILVERIEHGDSLSKLIPGSLWVQGKDTLATRRDVIKQLKTGKGDIIGIATQGIFNTGINVYVGNFINAAGGKAEHVIKQRIGRGLRPADDKDILNYYDFYFENNEYLEKHSKKRVKILKKDGHPVEIKEVDF